MEEHDNLKNEAVEEKVEIKKETTEEPKEIESETVEAKKEFKSEEKVTKRVDTSLEKKAITTATLVITNMALGVIYSIFLIAILAGGVVGSLAGSIADITTLLTGLGAGAVAFTVLVFIAASVISLVAFILHIIITVEYGQKEDKNAVIFALLIVGFFIGIVDIVSLFMLASEEKKKRAKA